MLCNSALWRLQPRAFCSRRPWTRSPSRATRASRWVAWYALPRARVKQVGDVGEEGGLDGADDAAGAWCLVETIRGFFKQLREAIAFRLVDEVFPNGEKSTWWMFFAKRKFMNKELSR